MKRMGQRRWTRPAKLRGARFGGPRRAGVMVGVVLGVLAAGGVVVALALARWGAGVHERWRAALARARGAGGQ
ncbi:MAG: hypothetical protein H6703_03625 [Myxococcales bacterium]|nr:hypothetical protein [Myxococcales bacterium]